MNPGTLLIRADASLSIGSGHVMRCLALAQGWRRNGGDVMFAMAEAMPAIERRLAEESCRIVRVPHAAGTGDDLKGTKALLAAESPSWIVLDGYRFDSSYRAEIEQANISCLVIDDNGGGECFQSSLVLNQNAHAADKLYPQRAPHTRLLLGPRYATLRREFVSSRDSAREIPGTAKRVLVTMGGSDPNNFAAKILPHLTKRLGSDVQIRVVVGGMAEHGNGLESLVSSFPRVQVLRDVRNMAEVMAWADFAVAGAGTTCWELCCLGLPAIIVEAADNQRLLARKLDAMGVLVNAGPAQQVDCAALAERTRALLDDHEARSEMSRRERRLLDGRGTERVLTFMSSELRIRRAEVRDCRMLWEWANDPVVRAASFSAGAISWDTHREWFEQQLASAAARIYVIEKSSEPVGEVRYQIEGKRATLSINLAPERRGQGLGSKFLLLGIEELFNTAGAEVIDAYVKPSNERSLELFRAAGFEENGVSEVRGQPAVWFALKRWGAGE